MPSVQLMVHTSTAAHLLPSDSQRGTEKKGVSQNCLACCSFDLCFQYVLSGWDGLAADAAMYENARQTDLTVLAGKYKYYLADAGFGACDALLVPYRKVCYHLAEWGHAGVRWASYLQ
jgi:hypothetical protein